MEFVSVFDEASRDVEAEEVSRRRTAATQQAASHCWPFLSLAQSEAEFGHRLALVEDRLNAIASRHEVRIDEVVEPLRNGFLAVLESRKEAGLAPKAAAGMACANCGHSSPGHEVGEACECGCVEYQPSTRVVTAERTGPTIDSAEGYEYEPAPEHVQRAMRRRFEGGGITAVHPDKPGYYLHGVGNWWDGPSEVKDNGDGSYTYTNPYNGDTDRFDEHGYYSTSTYHAPGPDADPSDMGRVEKHDPVHTPWGREASILAKIDEQGARVREAFNAHMASLHQALMEGQDPLEWVAGAPAGAGGGEPSRHDTTEQFAGVTPVALDAAMQGAGGSGTPENPGGHIETQGSRLPFV